MSKQRVADFLTPEQIERLLGAEYITIQEDDWSQIRQRGTGCCPLEVALGCEKSFNMVGTVLRALGATYSDEHVLVRFMSDVDNGRVTVENLREALGL